MNTDMQIMRERIRTLETLVESLCETIDGLEASANDTEQSLKECEVERARLILNKWRQS